MASSKITPVKEEKLIALSKEVALALKTERERQAISQNELAQRSGMSRTGLRAIELHINSPTLVSFLRISAGLKVSLGEIVQKTEKSLHEK